MTTIRAYTTIEQSRKLAEILPLESADMCWTKYIDDGEITSLHAIVNYGIVSIDTPCWSLAALLDILAKETHNMDEDGHVVLSSYKGNWWNVSPINCISGEIKESNNPLDACYEMILKLNKQKLL